MCSKETRESACKVECQVQPASRLSGHNEVICITVIICLLTEVELRVSHIGIPLPNCIFLEFTVLSRFVINF